MPVFTPTATQPEGGPGMITQAQIDKAAATKKIVGNLELFAIACNEAGFPFFLGLAILEKESNGRNVYGRDAGGALSGFPGEVNQANYEVFRWLVDVQKMKSNGVGPMQLTWSGFFPDAAAKGLKVWEPFDNMRYALSYILMPRFRKERATKTDREAFRLTAVAYNGAEVYGTDALVKADAWRAVVGDSDTLVKWT